MLLALEAVVDIAYNHGEEPAQAQDITKNLGVPLRYLEQVMQKLVRAGVLTGVRGPRGGYQLAGDRRHTTVGEIVRLLDEAKRPATALLESEASNDIAEHVLRPWWLNTHDMLMRELDGITIDDLCRQAQMKNIATRTGRPVQFDI